MSKLGMLPKVLLLSAAPLFCSVAAADCGVWQSREGQPQTYDALDSTVLHQVNLQFRESTASVTKAAKEETTLEALITDLDCYLLNHEDGELKARIEQLQQGVELTIGMAAAGPGPMASANVSNEAINIQFNPFSSQKSREVLATQILNEVAQKATSGENYAGTYTLPGMNTGIVYEPVKESQSCVGSPTPCMRINTITLGDGDLVW